MSTERDALFQGVEGAGGPSQAAGEDMSASEMSDTATACHSGVQVEQQTDSQVNTGRADAEAVRQSHGGAKRRRGGRAKLDTDFGEETLAALRTRAKRLGLAPSTWVRTVVRDALHASRSEELDAAVAAHLLGVEARVQASAVLASWPRRFARWRSTSTTSTAGRGLVSQWRCRRRCPS